MLALAALSQGIVWSSCSPDFGVDGVLDRFGQIEPKVLFCRRRLRLQRAATTTASSACARSPSACRGCARSWWCRTSTRARTSSDIPKAVTARRMAARAFQAETIAYAQLPFDHPVYILFTSGTTGKPKCIVHGAGGSLLAAPEDVQAAVRRAAERPLLFLLHHQLGGVEPALRTALCAEATRDALRRLAVRARRQDPVRLRRAGSASRISAPRRSSSTPSPSAASRRARRTTFPRCA